MMTRPGCEDECAVMRCMLLGLQQGLPDDVVEAFKRTNTFHVLSISGLHIGVVWSVWWCIAWAAGVPGTWRPASAESA